jgi:hypothetical protein
MTRAVAASWRAYALLGLAVFGAVAILVGAFGATWAAEMRQPRVVLLGAGDRVSVLVTGGDARLLIATGNDRTAFGNALGRVRRPTTPRIDVLLVAGSGEDLVVPAAVRDDRRVRYAASLGPLPSSAGGVAAAGAGLPVLPSPREIRLGDGVRVTVETATDEEGATHWRAVVRRGATAVAIFSDGDAAAAFPPLPPVAALVVAGRNPLAAWAAMPAPVLAVAGVDRVVSGKKLREEGPRLLDGSGWAVRVHPGEAVPLRFVADGLEVPRDPAQPIAATPGIGTGGGADPSAASGAGGDGAVELTSDLGQE